MVLGLRSKSRKSVSVQVHYLIHVQEVKPWPPTESLKSSRSLFIQWENGDQNSGSLTCGVRDGIIGIGESFRLPVTLCREASRKGTTHERFQKNSLDFYLYEPRKDKAVKGQVLGTAAINLADFGVIRETITVRAQLNCKRSFKNSMQPILYVNIQPLDRDSSSSSPKDSLSKEVSLEKSKSYSQLTNDGNDEETEIAAFTDDDDDDLSSHSSQHITSSTFETGGYSPQRRDQSKSESAKDSTESVIVGILEDEKKKELQENGQEEEEQTLELETCHVEEKLVGKLSNDAALKQVKFRHNTLSFSGYSLGVQGLVHRTNEIKHVKSVQFPLNSNNSSATFKTSRFMEQEDNINVPEAASAITNATSESKATINDFSKEKSELECKVKMLEEELREAAAVEVALYSVVAEHGSSATKIHAPARRLSRFYLHACKARSPANRASAARTAVSGLVLVVKACGNDVPRLTFWLSNSILLRAIISQAIEKLQLSAGRNTCSNEESSLHVEQNNNAVEYFEDWEDPQTLIVALENIEAWIFCRIIESVWWQTLTPHMQPAIAKGSGSRKTHGRRYGLGDREQGNFSIDLWKKAFKDSCERLCPLRAGGHQCGCLRMLARLVMEQLVDRLDVAMFNAILRESAEEMPTDPVSDPISDCKVLPVPAGKSSFGSGAQLKNAIGNWSRWLTDLFGIDDSDLYEDGIETDDKKLKCEKSFKAFHLLNALSDLMMLPFEMIADRSIRKEVCPKFSGSLIKRILNNFVPDEFCSDPIPEAVFKAIDSEDFLEDEDYSISSFPCTAASTVYQPPPAASLTSIIGEVGSQAMRSGSSVLRKSHTSDDELDELVSPTTSIGIENFRGSPTSVKPNLMLKKGKGRKIVRYQLLREVWRDDE
ncbi:uncharacterized protein LOC122313593 isoform X1 [Carya illinoinensis]|uniref:C2 NT-type domain-containing protein n=1 Tax=Carya illinoinensis TaxID=32201 RepID=A0A8T1Q9X1_CARIL|nr:uncharacterized protein LOC122313593 isoform X1 [Carya illinoinensis]XP_042984670.1 uncharacterized protein LOC122313593 isoform X1 [Carya illinoinensis]XP_042984671.1 uncharacterized protein LOC122313593 isoform X1 [Carya illinoinensis]KAG6651286.1 hypothetical protein CIPAW_06G100300 [Carya illinoinensis]